MKKISSDFKVHKFVLKNGLQVLLRPTTHLPQVDVQLWYNVGSKDEDNRERGMAHLLEHMLFKGTKRLSESDINLITHKLSGYANAFTSHDYTAYIFRFPSNAWEESLSILADCMKNSRFDEQMLASELLTVIQEMKMYKDEYDSTLIEAMASVIFPEHPYHHPVIGYKQDLCNLRRDDLVEFYKKHYHPDNATLVIVGNIEVESALKKIEKHFGDIPAHKQYRKHINFFNEDVISKRVTLYREVTQPTCYYAYLIPGVSSFKSYLFDMVAMILGGGKSSRLYELLVNKHKLASNVETFTYDMFEMGLLFISVQPKDESSIEEIEIHLNGEIEALSRQEVADWEFEPVYNRIRFEFASLLESNERQGFFIGGSYLATGDEDYLSKYFDQIRSVTKKDITQAFAGYIKKSVQHKGYILPIPEEEKDHLDRIQDESDALDQKVLSLFERTSTVEPGKEVEKIALKPPVSFKFPKPESFKLSNGIEVFYHHTTYTPHVSVLLHFKVDFLYDPAELSGLSYFLSKVLLEGTKKHSDMELNKMLERNGIYIRMSPGLITVQLMPESLEKTIEVITEILSEPAFDVATIEKVRSQIESEIKDFWDNPTEFSEQIAREIVYKEHPYAKSGIGTLQGIANITREQLIEYHRDWISPQQAVMVIVGDLTEYSHKKLHDMLEKKLACWKGKEVPDLLAPRPVYEKPEIIDYDINRDQVVLAFAAPSLPRKDKEFESLAIIDVILTGGPLGSLNSRLFQLRERSGLFYTISGSLIYEPKTEPGMILLKTIVSLDKMSMAEELIKETIQELGEKGISHEEFEMAKNALINASVEYFDSTLRTAHTFLYLKRCELGFDLFDKRGQELSILKIEEVNEVAKKFCNRSLLSVVRVGRIKDLE